MGKLRAFYARLPRWLLPWALLSVLFFIGTTTAVVSIIKVPKAELARATEQGQRVTADPVTGKVSGLAKKPEPEAPATDEEAETTDADAEHKPAAEEKKPEAAAHPEVATPVQAESIAKDAHPAEEPKPEASAHSTEPEESSHTSPAGAAKLATHATPVEIPNVRVSGESIVAPGAIEVTESLHGQPLPKIGTQGLAPSTLYAKSFAPTPEMTRVSIVLTEAGFNAQSVALMLKLPRTVTIAFTPYAPGVQANIAKLHAAGFETWGMLPTMGANYPKNDPGPLGLIASLPPEETMRRLRTVMSNTLGSAGMVLQPDEALSNHSRAYSAMVSEITGRGLWLLSTHPTRTVDAASGGDAKLAPSIRRADVLLDANATAAEIQSKLDGLKDLSLKKSRIIVVMPARPLMIEQLADWLNHNGLKDKAEIAPLSAMYRKDAPPPEAEKKDAHGKPADAHGDKKDDAKKSNGAH